MKKSKLLLFILLFSFILSGCSLKFPSLKEVGLKGPKSEFVSGNFTGSMQKGNYVYGAAMNLAWQELADNILKTTGVEVVSEDEKTLELAKKFNNSSFSKNDLDENDYYVASGFGQQTVGRINKESKEKFPSKSFSNLDLDLDICDAISYAYFLKEVEYLNQFEKTKFPFLGQSIKGFEAITNKQSENVQVMSYENDDKFIIRLQLKQQNDELYLIKGYDMNSPDDAVLALLASNKNKLGFLSEDDVFKTPIIHLSISRIYGEMIGKYVKSSVSYCDSLSISDSFTAQIDVMYENINFDMDEKGARVENEAVIGADFATGLIPTKKPRLFILDKPYWVIMKQKDSNNPYFILGVNNTEFMEK